MDNYKIKQIYHDNIKALEDVKRLLNSQGLTLERTVHKIYGLYEGKKLIATGSSFDNVLKMIAVDVNYQGTNVINKMMSFLINQANASGITKMFIYTTPSKYQSFEYFGFYTVVKTDKVVLLENNPLGIERYLKTLKIEDYEHMESAAIILNCNPFTLGHRYLVERASTENKKVHIFVLWENLSTFPNDIRFKLVKEGVKDFENVEIHWAKDYVISSATFPSYFLGDRESVIEEHAKVDVKIFGEYIAPLLNIKKRYIGQEPLNPVTRKYNEQLKTTLPTYGVEVIELERIKNNEKVISASSVRRYLAENKWDELRKIVPKSTMDYLISDEASFIIEKLKKHYKAEKLV